MGTRDRPHGETAHRPRSAFIRFVLRDGLLVVAVICYVTGSVLLAVHAPQAHRPISDTVWWAADALRTAAFLMLVGWGFMRAHVERSWGRAIRALHDVAEFPPPPGEPATRDGEPQWPHRRRAG